ncbi:MAG TPA: hypothetical protein PKD86_03555 [Gemmatales bacterium]|nr:hypothetical protein [Gemmatales bacterium]
MTRPTSNSTRLSESQRALIFLGVVLGLVGLFVVQNLWWTPVAPAGQAVALAVLPERPPVSAIELADWRRRAWDRIQVRLDAADAASQQAMADSQVGLHQFFASRHGSARKYAGVVLSFKGKWIYVKSCFPWAEGNEHAQFLMEEFRAQVFRPEELQACMADCIQGYLSRLRGIENQLLVEIRQDLSEGEWAFPSGLQPLMDQRHLQHAFDRRLGDVQGLVGQDVSLRLGKEFLSLAAGDLAGHLLVKVGLALAGRTATSASLLGAGAATGWATLGVGLAAAVVIDLALDAALSAAGYDPEAVVAEKIGAELANMERMLLDGVPEAVSAFAKMVHLAQHDPDPEVRAACQRSVEKIACGGCLGLRFELRGIHEQRLRMRREALRRILLEDEVAP